MTDFSILDRNADKALEEVNRLFERGAYYEQQQDKVNALTNYIDALSAYPNLARWNNESTRVRMPIDMNLMPRETAMVYSSTLFDMVNILGSIQRCYTDSVTKAFLEEKLLMISNKLGEYEPYFDVEQLDKCNSLRKRVNQYKSHVESNREAIEELKKKSIKELDDQNLAKIRSALEKISSSGVCPLTLDSISSCFIATAAYSTSKHPDIDTFRNFRDEKLLTNPVGKQLVNLYYQIGPSIAKYVEKQPAIKNFLRHQLERLAEWMRH